MTRQSATAGKRARLGFTIIELMLVVAIISILLVIAIPAFQSYSVRAKVSEGMLVATPVLKTVAEYYHSNNIWPADNTEAGVLPKENFSTRYVVSVEVTADPAILITLNASELSGIGVGSNTIVYTPRADATRTVQWSCAGGTLPRWARPPRCRT